MFLESYRVKLNNYLKCSLTNVLYKLHCNALYNVLGNNLVQTGTDLNFLSEVKLGNNNFNHDYYHAFSEVCVKVTPVDYTLKVILI